MSINQGFAAFLSTLTPTQAEITTARKHRASVESALSSRLEVSLYRETGSFHHGTGVRFRSDIDLLVSLNYQRPGSTSTALNWVKDALTASFPSTVVRVSRPAVVVDFASGAEPVEVIPAFLQSTDPSVYVIPGIDQWITTAPTAHLDYANEINKRPSIAGGAKALARLAKAWKYYRNVPISSFYLEMRAASYMNRQTSFIPYLDLAYFFDELSQNGLASMNDPLQLTSRINPCSSEANLTDARSKLATALTRATKATASATSEEDAYDWWDKVFNGYFPSYS